jgi:hypothetical protein
MEGLKHSGSGSDSIGGEGENSETAVPLPARSHYITVVPADNLLNKRVMANEGSAGQLRVLFPELSAFFYICEQECDCTGGQSCHDQPPAHNGLVGRLYHLPWPILHRLRKMGSFNPLAPS